MRVESQGDGEAGERCNEDAFGMDGILPRLDAGRELGGALSVTPDEEAGLRKRVTVVVVTVLMSVASYSIASLVEPKLPKCSGQLCRSVGCSADVLCASGTGVKTCAEVCHR